MREFGHFAALEAFAGAGSVARLAPSVAGIAQHAARKPRAVQDSPVGRFVSSRRRVADQEEPERIALADSAAVEVSERVARSADMQRGLVRARRQLLGFYGCSPIGEGMRL